MDEDEHTNRAVYIITRRLIARKPVGLRFWHQAMFAQGCMNGHGKFRPEDDTQHFGARLVSFQQRSVVFLVVRDFRRVFLDLHYARAQLLGNLPVNFADTCRTGVDSGGRRGPLLFLSLSPTCRRSIYTSISCSHGAWVPSFKTLISASQSQYGPTYLETDKRKNATFLKKAHVHAFLIAFISPPIAP